MTGGGEIAKAEEITARFDQAEHRQLIQKIGGYLAQRRKLLLRVGFGLRLGSGVAAPGQEAALACDRDAVGFCLRKAIRKTAIGEEGPAKFAGDKNVCGFRNAGPWRAAMFFDERKSLRASWTQASP